MPLVRACVDDTSRLSMLFDGIRAREIPGFDELREEPVLPSETDCPML